MILGLFVIFVGGLLVALLKLYLTKRRMKKILGHVPTVRNDWPIIGHAHWFLFRNTKRKFGCYTICIRVIYPHYKRISFQLTC